MQLPENNMDDLFRKAAGDYPLKTDNDDWDAVAGRLADETGIPSTEKTVGGNNYRRMLWLLALLPLMFICNKYISDNSGAAKSATQQSANNATADIKNKDRSTERSGETNMAVAANPLQQAVLADKNAKDHSLNNSNDAKQENEKVSGNENNFFAKAPSYNNDAKRFSEGNGALNNNSVDEKNINAGNNLQAIHNSNGLPNKNNDAQTKINSTVDLQTAIANTSDNSNKKIAENSGKQNIAAKNSDSSSNKNVKKKIVLAAFKQPGFYAGIIVGPDASTVKFQAIKGAGYSLGLLAGYSFSQHWSVEAGLLWDKKKYYTDGKYFNSSKANIPPYIQLQDMNGNCSMYEIPIDVKYDFAAKRNGNFFMTAGLSTYLMKNEAYDYSAVTNTGWMYNSSESYSNSSRDWFSILQLSAGYQKQIGAKTKIRVEPYFKIPMKGLGIGNLPITSAGMYIGITRSIH